MHDHAAHQPAPTPDPAHTAPRTAEHHWLGDHAGTLATLDRWPALILFLTTAAPLAVASQLTPDANGIGTHTQLGLSSCGFESTTGLPCATCGYTTTFALTTHAQPVAAFLNQPAGFATAVLAALACVLAAWSLATGMRLAPITTPLGRPRVWVPFATFVLLAWLYKIALHTHAVA